MESFLINDMVNKILIEAKDEEKENFSQWILDGDVYFPATSLKVKKKLPSGVYKITMQKGDSVIKPIPIKTDELFTFSEDYTSNLIDEIKVFWEKRDVYKSHNMTHKRGVLLCGGPGTGKSSVITLAIKQIIEMDGLVFLINNINEFACTTQMLGPVLRKIEPNRPIITIIEDVDQLVRLMGGDSELLDFLDGKTTIDNQIVILTSNDTSELSPALLRPSRIDTAIEILNPSDRVIEEFFIKKGIKEEDVHEYVKATSGMSFAELKEVFIGTQILGKPLNRVIEQIENPFEFKDYLNKNTEMKGID